MRTTTKLILANSMIAVLVVLSFATFSLYRFYQQELREENRNLEKGVTVFRELLARDGARFRVVDGKLLAGDRVVNGDYAVADQVQRVFGGVATIFLGDRRVSTNLLDASGRRAVGTRLEGDAYVTVFKEGKPYRGEANILGHPYLTAYDPIRNGGGAVIGAIFVGMEKSGFLEQFKAANAPIMIMVTVLLTSLALVTVLLWKVTRHFETEESNNLRLLRTLMDTIPNPIYYKDASGCYLGFNKACKDRFGKRLDRFVGKTAHDLWPRDLAEQYTRNDRELFDTPGTQMYEDTMVYANGTRHDVIVNRATFHSQSGAVAGLVGVIMDITERKAAEDETKNANRRLHDIIEFLPDATFVVDGGGRVIAWNKSIEAMTGVKKEAIVGQGDYAYALPFYGVRRPLLIDLIDEDPDRIDPNYPFLTREGNTLFSQTLIPEIEGRKSRYIWATAAPLYDDRGLRVGGIESMRDITDYKRVETELRFRNLMLSTQLESSIDGILAVDEHAHLVSYNRRFLEIFCIPPSVLEAASDRLLFKAAMEQALDPQAFLERSREIYDSRETSRDEMVLKNGAIIDRYSAPMVDADGCYHGRVWYFRDISEQKHTEEVRLRFEAQRHHSQMMESFITQLGHDLRTPLTPLFALIPLIREKIEDPNLALMIDICQQSVVCVHELTEKALKLVALSASTTGLLEHVRLADEVAGYLQDNGGLLGSRNLSLENLIDPELVVLVVPDQLRELFDNLISNAARYTPAGGSLRFSAVSHGDTVTVAVADDGIGVEPADLEHIFDEFFKVDASRHDLSSPGLGLSICRRIVANHQGTIWAESPGKGGGLTVRFTLPLQ